MRFFPFSYPNYVFDLSSSTAIGCVDRVSFRILVSLESLLCQFTPANACQQRLELGGDRTKPSPSDGFSDLLAGERLGFPTLGGSIYRESLRDFTRKIKIFIDRETALKPQEKIHRHSEGIFCHLKKLDYLGATCVTVQTFYFTFSFVKNFEPCL